jgi:hypothetical protein
MSTTDEKGGATMSTDVTTTFDRVLHVLADGEWHTEEELEEVSYFPREWIKELEVSGYPVTTVENGSLHLRLTAASQ